LRFVAVGHLGWLRLVWTLLALQLGFVFGLPYTPFGSVTCTLVPVVVWIAPLVYPLPLGWLPCAALMPLLFGLYSLAWFTPWTFHTLPHLTFTLYIEAVGLGLVLTPPLPSHTVGSHTFPLTTPHPLPLVALDLDLPSWFTFVPLCPCVPLAWFHIWFLVGPLGTGLGLGTLPPLVGSLDSLRCTPGWLPLGFLVAPWIIVWTPTVGPLAHC